MKRKVMWIAVSLIVTLGLVIGAFGCAAPTPTPTTTPTPTPTATPTPVPTPTVEKHEWTMQSWHGRGDSFFQVSQMFADMVTRDSGGRLTIELFGSGELVPGGNEMDAVVEGSMEAGSGGTIAEMGKIGKSGTLFSTYPCGPNVNVAMDWFLEGGGMDLLQEAYDVGGVDVLRLVPHTPSGAEPFGYFNREIKTTADLGGLKFRTYGIYGEVLTKYFDVAVTAMPGGELYQSLERGVLDAFEYAAPGTNWGLGFHEIAKFMYIPGIQGPWATDSIGVNRDAWAALSPDLQSLVWDLAKATALEGMAFLTKMDIDAMANYNEYAKTHDFEVKELPIEVQKEIVMKCNEYYDEVMASGEDPMFNKTLTSLREFMEGSSQVRGKVWADYDKILGQ
ncbi:TRAP transporter substrate-binding protein [Chloroflexota bacterium]